jgi:peptide deformylase
MGVMDVLRLGSEQLRQKTRRIEKIDGAYTRLAEAMIEVLRAHQGVGLAGPQVGINEKIFVVDVKDAKPLVFINPSIIETSEEKCGFEEGCLSIPNVWAEVTRPAKVTVQAWNERGRPFTLKTGGLLARVIQHECDHLEGVLFIDHLSEVKRERLVAKYKKLANKKNASKKRPATAGAGAKK